MLFISLKSDINIISNLTLNYDWWEKSKQKSPFKVSLWKWKLTPKFYQWFLNRISKLICKSTIQTLWIAFIKETCQSSCTCWLRKWIYFKIAWGWDWSFLLWWKFFRYSAYIWFKKEKAYDDRFNSIIHSSWQLSSRELGLLSLSQNFVKWRLFARVESFWIYKVLLSLI